MMFASLSGSPVNTSNWTLQGNAHIGNVMNNNLSEVVLTTTNFWQTGSIFYNTPINLSVCSRWIAEFDFRMYDGNFPGIYGNGADGIAFCYLDTPPSGFVSGYGMGIPSTANGLKVCFDTYPNCTMNYADAPSIEIRWGQGYNECWAQPTIQNDPSGTLSFFRGNYYNHAKITYDNGTISVYVNNNLYLQGFQQFNFPGYFGLTSSTGAGYDNNSIKNLTIYADFPPSNAGTDLTLASGQGGMIGCPNTPGYLYNWTPNAGLNNSQYSAPIVNHLNNTNQVQNYQYIVSTSLAGSTACFSTDTVLIHVLPLNTEVNVSVCNGQSYMGHTTSGTFIDTLTSLIGFDSIRTLHLQVLPKGIINHDSVSCSPAIVSLTANDALEYHWFPNNNIITNSNSSASLNLNSSQTIYLSSSYAGNNLVVNGDFESGNTGFFSSYPYCNSNNCLYTIAGYAINTNANYSHILFYGTDHTTGTGNFMIINGAIQNATVWKETIPVTPNTDYYFGAYVSSLMTVDPAFIQFSVNGQLIGNIFPAPSSINMWDRFFTTWNSGSNTTATIEIVDVNPVTSGNDWGIDDIFFGQKYNCIDSVRFIIPTVDTSTTLINSCGSYNWNGTNYNATGVYFHSLNSVEGCDSVAKLILTINSGTHNSFSQTACDNYNWHGNVYNTAGNFIFNYLNSTGCLSTDTLHLTIYNATHNSTNTIACDSIRWHNNLYISNGNYLYNYSNSLGCPSTDTLHLIINNSSHNISNQTACDSLSWHGNHYTNSGVYIDNYLNTTGCQSADTLHLIINASSHNTNNLIFCDSINWHGTYYHNTGTYTFNYTNNFGCQSTDTAHITILLPTHISNTQITCDTLTWHGSLYSNSGTYLFNYINAQGCNSTDTLHLTVNHSTHNSSTIEACDSIRWNGTLYTSSGLYTHNYVNAQGCQSSDTLHLTIDYSTHTNIIQTACDSLRWHDNLYTTSGTYNFQYSNPIGCLSTDTLHLQINYATHFDLNKQACDNYNWHGLNYNSTGIYLYTYLNSSGCLSTDTLHLTILPGPLLGPDKVLKICFNSFLNLDTVFHYGLGNAFWTMNGNAVINQMHVRDEGIYQLIVEDQNNCIDTAILNLIIQPEIFAYAGHDTIVQANTDFHLNGIGGMYYQWSPVNYLNNPYISNPIANINNSTYFVLHVFDNNGCKDNDTIFVKTINSAGVYVPTSFTPNGDGINDIFRPILVGINELIYFKIFDRYGMEIFSTNTINKGWDGNFKNFKQPINNYVWILSYKEKNGKISNKKGNVFLIR